MSNLIKKYAGIGSRETPPHILMLMDRFAQHLAKLEYELHSGRAKGADKEFEKGCDKVKGKKRIWLPQHTTPESLTLAAQFHPAWHRCDEYAKRLHARNGLILLGADLNTPVEFIVCWTSKALITGGTGQALRIAEAWHIRVYNLANEVAIQQLFKRIETSMRLKNEH